MIRKIFIAALAVAGLTFGSAVRAKAETVIVLTTQNQVLSFDSATPGTTTVPVAISGLVGGETIIGLDRRPTNGLIYGVSSAGRIYTINETTGAAALVSTISGATLSGGAFGVDFNPAADTAGMASLRVVSNGGGNNNQNLAVNVTTGAATVQTPLQYAASDTNAGQNPNVVGAAYSNNVLGATTTTLYDIDTNLGVLVTQNPIAAGTLNTVGSLGFNSSGVIGFDISGLTGVAYAALNPNDGNSNLFTINLSTGAATLIGQIGSGYLIRGLTTQVGQAAPVPEPATMILLGTGLAGIAAQARRRRRQARKTETA